MDGLWQQADIYERRAVDDGYGSVKDRLVLVKANVRCRFTRLTEEEAQYIQGQGSRTYWRVSSESVPGLSYSKHYVIRRAKETF